MPDDFKGAATPLSDTDINATAANLNCEVAVVEAVCDVESGGSGFLPDGRPKILFEAHAFHNATGGRWDRANPNISSPAWDRSLYGAGGAHQYDRLAEAIALDRNAALQSASWGRFQVMGNNYAAAGFANAEAFVQAMCDREAAHLGAFIGFCRKNGLVEALQACDWTTFARGYNGPDKSITTLLSSNPPMTAMPRTRRRRRATRCSTCWIAVLPSVSSRNCCGPPAATSSRTASSGNRRKRPCAGFKAIMVWPPMASSARRPGRR
jgi:hypothetical protein